MDWGQWQCHCTRDGVAAHGDGGAAHGDDVAGGFAGAWRELRDGGAVTESRHGGPGCWGRGWRRGGGVGLGGGGCRGRW